MSTAFDIRITSNLTLRDSPIRNLAEFLFNELEHRPEEGQVIISHIGNDLEQISLSRLRFLIGALYAEFDKKGLKKNDTVMLATLPGNNELFIAIMFLALASYGVRVFLPMYMESDDLNEWVKLSNTSSLLLSRNEVESLKHQVEKKNALKKIIDQAEAIGIDIVDFRKEFNLDELLTKEIFNLEVFETIIDRVKKETSADQEALIITTSGTSGKSKLVVHKQKSFINSCLSWEAAGFYDENLFGGRGFTPLFTHTMGIRAFFNALWIGQPMCLIITDWFTEKPEIVAYLIRKMKPEHITGGPAVYNLFLELVRNFPELNEVTQNSFKCLVGSGAPFDEKFEKKIHKQFGLIPFNAYGTTETQQTLSTVLNNPGDSQGMGQPLPGVEIGLKAFDLEKDIYELHIKGPMSCDSIINDSNSFSPDGYFDSGDLVKYDGEHITYYGRENTDFIKDQFGVKIPIRSVREYYHDLHENVSHIEYFSINDTPGLAALIFVDSQHELEQKLTKQFKGMISSANNDLLESIEPFEYNHRSIKRARIIFAPTPLTAKGNPSRYKIKESFFEEIKELSDPLASSQNLINLIDDFEYTDSFTRYNNPYIGQMLQTLGLDHHYHKAEGNYLFTMLQGKEQRILDFTGGYGTNLLGHNHNDLKHVLTKFIDENHVAISDQGSIQQYTGELAKKISITLGKLTNRNFNVMFGNSGSEAVEMALHHSLLVWKKSFESIRDQQYQTFGAACSELLDSVWKSNEAKISAFDCSVLAIRNGFHGNSTGARSVLGNDKKRLLFKNLTNVQPLFINDTDPDWEQVLKTHQENSIIALECVKFVDGEYTRSSIELSGIIAAIVEPIIGEGGVRETSPSLLKTLSESPIALIIDEIQSGLGRSGSFLASQGIVADYYLFGKALGGNLTKLSAMCVDKQVFINKFGEYYVSTFANGGLATHIGSKVLDIIERDNIPERARLIGEELKGSLKSLVDEFPDVLLDIKGKGLMLGIYFQNFSENESLVLRNLYQNDKLGYIFSSYFFHTHNIRIFPTLSAPNVLRVEPSAYLNETNIKVFVNALRELCKIVQSGNMYELLLPLMEGDSFQDYSQMEQRQYSTALDVPCAKGKKVAFIAHYTHPVHDMKMSIPELKKASDTGIRILFNKMQVLLEMSPFLLYSQNIFEGQINFNFIVIPLDSAQMERMHRTGKRREIIHQIQKAVDMANQLGAEVVSLGAYTSIITNNGMSILEPKGTRVITGNTLTVATGTKHLIDVAQNTLSNQPKTVAVIGAGGNIGSAVAETLIKSELQIKQLLLIGRKEAKLKRTLSKYTELSSVQDLVISTDFDELKKCDIIVIATNTSDPIIFEHHLSPTQNVIISDVSVPSAVHQKVVNMKNVHYIPFSSYITLPYDPNFMMSSVTPAGTTFCCAAESILCGLEQNSIPLKGNIPQEAIEQISALAEKQGLFKNIHATKSFKE